MKRLNYILLLSLFLGFFNPLKAQKFTGNPLFRGADPEIHYFNGKYYIYPTSTDTKKFHAWSSTDLSDWKDEGVIFDIGPQCLWTDRNGWAPGVAFKNNKYYFYYTADTKIGVAVGDSPLGPFTDPLGVPLIATDPYTNDIIDAMVFTDDDKQTYIYYGGSSGARMVVRKLNPDMISINGGATDITPPGYTEAPYIVKRNGIYYMTYSNGYWGNQTYNVRYSTSNSPVGPWTYRGVVLQSNNEDLGPGHHGILKIGDCDEYYIVYHRYENGLGGSRQTCIDRMYFNSAGLIDPVNMTNYGVQLRIPDNSCSAKAIVSGGIYKLTHKGTDKCLDVLSNSSQPGTNVGQYTDNGNDAQRWVITVDEEGFYKLRHKGTNQCLEVVNNSSASGANVQQNTDNGSNAQRWEMEAMSGGYYKLTHKGTNLCLNVENNSNVNNANVNQSASNSTDAQRWELELIEAPIVSGGLYRLTHKGTNQCLDVENNSTKAGANVHQWTDMKNTNSQRWYVTLESDGFYQLKHKGTNMCLDVGNNSNQSGADVAQWTDNDMAGQRWKIELQADGYYKLIHKGTTMCLNVDSNLTRPGANVIQYTDNGSDAQRWKLDLMPDVDPVAGTGTGLAANYFNGTNFEAPGHSTVDATVNFDWAAGSPHAAVNTNLFSARWTGLIQPEYTGEYTFYITSDNGRRLWINDQLIIDKWVNDVGINSGKVTLTAGQKYEIRAEYYENSGDASVKLEWESFMQSIEVVPQKQLYANTLPTVSLTSPANDQTFDAPAAIAITANAGDAGGNVQRVEFYNGSVKLGEDTMTPFAYNWTGVIKGAYTITARAYDNRNAVTVSSAVNIVVSDPITTDIADAQVTEGLKISPNPAEYNLYISTTEDLSGAYISIFDAQGKLVSKPVLHGNAVSVNDLHPGFYIIEISNHNSRMVQRFIKK